MRRGLVGTFLKRFEQRGLKIVAMKVIKATSEQIENHYIEYKVSDSLY